MAADQDFVPLFTRLLTQEAWLRDNDRFDEWLEFFADPCRYWAPTRTYLERGEENFRQKDRMHHIDEDRQGLALRVKRLSSGMTFTDEPPARTRRLISNVQVLEATKDSATVISYFLMFRSHPGHRDVTVTGYKDDKWILMEKGWRIRERMMVIDQDRMESYLTLL